MTYRTSVGLSQDRTHFSKKDVHIIQTIEDALAFQVQDSKYLEFYEAWEWKNF